MHFLHISRGSAAEIETQLLISKNLNYIEASKDHLTNDLVEILKMLTSLINKIKQRI